jgi:hypothetical protein
LDWIWGLANFQFSEGMTTPVLVASAGKGGPVVAVRQIDTVLLDGMMGQDMPLHTHWRSDRVSEDQAGNHIHMEEIGEEEGRDTQRVDLEKDSHEEAEDRRGSGVDRHRKDNVGNQLGRGSQAVVAVDSDPFPELGDQTTENGGCGCLEVVPLSSAKLGGPYYAVWCCYEILRENMFNAGFLQNKTSHK